jgi:hypothetical protein
MDEKTRKYLSLFKQRSLVNLLNISGSFELLYNLLTEEEIDVLIENNVLFIRSCSPSSKIDLEDVIVNGNLTLINFDANIFSLLLPEEIIAILLHEIGHVLNQELQGMDAEYAADNFATQKGYARWIIASLNKGVQNNWLGFNVEECRLRIANIQNQM